MDDNDLTLAHTVIHNLYSVRKSEKEFIGSCHEKIVAEMEHRGINHSYFDKLDNI